MPITITDYVKSIVGDKPAYHAEDFYSNGVAMMGGCEICYAVLGGYNAYPSRSGYWRCADHIGDLGFISVEEFRTYLAPLTCPACDATRNIRIIPGGSVATLKFRCNECSVEWQS